MTDPPRDTLAADSQHSFLDYPPPGSLVDEKYRVQRLLGAGGMGAVMEATHVLRDAPVALKFMSPSLVDVPGVVERFLNEGVAASRINNEHVVAVLDVSRLPNGLPYLVMEYLDGEDLDALIEREGQQGIADVPRAVHFVLQVLRGLQVAHHAGIIHRDLKPANCYVITRDGEPDFVKLLDFGISKVQSAEPQHLTQVGSALGTPLYVSPEQAQDPASVDTRGDLYSVSVILYELLTGRTPFESTSGQLSELYMKLATKKPPALAELRSDLPEGLEPVVQKGLAKAPADRFQSTTEMAAALARFSDERSDLVLRQLLQRSSVNAHGLHTSEIPGRLRAERGPAPIAATLAGAGPEDAGSPLSGTPAGTARDTALVPRPKVLPWLLVPAALAGLALLVFLLQGDDATSTREPIRPPSAPSAEPHAASAPQPAATHEAAAQTATDREAAVQPAATHEAAAQPAAPSSDTPGADTMAEPPEPKVAPAAEETATDEPSSPSAQPAASQTAEPKPAASLPAAPEPPAAKPPSRKPQRPSLHQIHIEQ